MQYPPTCRRYRHDAARDRPERTAILLDQCPAEARHRPQIGQVFQPGDRRLRAQICARGHGYRPFEGLEAAAALARLYAAMRLFVNFFQPSFKLAAKARDGAQVRKPITRRLHRSRVIACT
jgi:hypothetical protein